MSAVLGPLTQSVQVALVDDEHRARSFVKNCLGEHPEIRYVEFAEADQFLASDIGKIDFFIVDKVFENETRIGDIIASIRARSEGEIVVFSNDPSSDVFDERAIRVLKGRAFLNPSELRTKVLEAMSSDSRFEAAIARIKVLDAEGPSGQTTINEIRLENITYPLKNSTEVVWVGGRYSLAGLFEHVTGAGETEAAAAREFVRKFHDKFCRLYGRFIKGDALASEDSAIWDAIQAVVDLDKHERTRTIVVPHELAQIERTEHCGVFRIKWLTRGTVDTVTSEMVPELAHVENGDWVCAKVRRRTDESLVSVLHLHWTEPPEFSASEINDFWNS
jgi:hypothetical protein